MDRNLTKEGQTDEKMDINKFTIRKNHNNKGEVQHGYHEPN